MSNTDLTATIRELRRMADELAAEIETLTDTIKEHMTTAGVDTLTARYPVERSPFAPYYIDPAGNVSYTGRDGQLALWCSGARLLGHFCRLASLGALVTP